MKFFLLKPVKAKEQVSHYDKCYRENTDPHQHSGNTLRFQIDKEVRIDQGGGGSGDQNRRIELQNNCLNHEEDHISKRERGRCDGVIPFALLALVKQEPVSDVHNRKHNMGQKAANAPVCLRIAAFCAGKHDVEHQKCQQNSQNSDKLQHRSSGNIAVHHDVGT